MHVSQRTCFLLQRKVKEKPSQSLEAGRWREMQGFVSVQSRPGLHLQRFPLACSLLGGRLGPSTGSASVAIDAKELVFLVGEAQVADARLAAPAAASGVDDGVADAAVAHPAGLTLVQELDLPGSVELADFGHGASVLLARLDSFWEA